MFGETTSNLPVASGGRRNCFSLEMTPEGVFLHLDSAAVSLPCGPVGVAGLTLGVPLVTFPFDCQAGPRALRSHISILESVTLDVFFQTVSGILSSALPEAGPGGLLVEPGMAGTLVLSGRIDGKSFSVRARFERDHRHKIKVLFNYPRIFGLSDRPWSWLTASFAGALVSAGADGNGSVDVLRPCLKPLLAGLGFKIPFMHDAVLESAGVSGDRLRFVFSGRSSPVSAGDSETSPPVERSPAFSPSTSEMLAGIASAPADPADVVALIEHGISRPMLWPEVLARSMALGNEHPELVSPLLAAALVGAENPGWISSQDLLTVCRRLMAASGAEGCRSETARCAALVAGLVDRFEPAAALDVLDEIRAGGFEGREVLEGVAMTFNRLGRHFDASTTRLRALAMTPAENVVDSVRSMIDRMDANGFGEQAGPWLVELSSLASSGRFGEVGGQINRAALIISASRDAVSDGGASRRGLRRLLDSNPADPEVLELMLALAREKHEVAEAVELFRTAADRASGRSRCDLLLVAARAVHERFGLRRKAVELLEAALVADPGCLEAAELLDTIYGALGRHADRVELAAGRLAGVMEPLDRAVILKSMVGAAVAAGMPEKAAEGVRALLKMDPSSLEFLKIGETVFADVGDQAALREVREALEDLSAPGAGLETALAAGDMAAAVGYIRSALGKERRPEARLELLLQGADLSLISGSVPSASAFLVEAGGLDPVAAIGSTCAACVAAAPDIPGALLDVVTKVARGSMTGDVAIEVAAVILDAAERLAGQSMRAAMVMLETALPLAPENVSIQMALAAAYEALGMKNEAFVLLGKD